MAGTTHGTGAEWHVSIGAWMKNTPFPTEPWNRHDFTIEVVPTPPPKEKEADEEADDTSFGGPFPTLIFLH